ncbi:hypothetical protein [Microbacterium sp.]|uniref:hypothetical protein n=1 Tax=Microbacterium sp. TaxID=51671 RepID=UPI0037C4F6D6
MRTRYEPVRSGGTEGQADGLPRNHAIVIGHYARMIKLMETLIRQIADGHGGDQQIAVSREFIDSVSTVMYLLGDPGDGSRYTSYVMDSLIAEREFLKEVREQVAQRNDVMLPIEERINRSIAETLKTAGMREEDIPSRRNKSFRRVVRPGPFQVRHRHRERAAPHAEGLRVHDRCRRVTRRDRRPRGSRVEQYGSSSGDAQVLEVRPADYTRAGNFLGPHDHDDPTNQPHPPVTPRQRALPA